MTVRRASSGDAAGVLRLLHDFDREQGLSHLATEEMVSAAIQSPDYLVFVDDEQGQIVACVVLLARRADRVLVVDGLYPRGLSRYGLIRVLGPALRQLVEASPELANTTIRARFHRAVDARGDLDGGRAQCRAWRQLFTRATVRQVEPGIWEISAPLRLAVEDAQRWL